jgi:translocation and assembly module TamB
MSRRRIVAIVAASVIGLLIVVVVGAVLIATHTDFGRTRLRSLAADYLARALKGRGTIYLGRIDGGLFTGFTIDSLEIRDADDSLFVATGPVHAEYNPNDLVDKRILFSRLEITRPRINLRRHADRSWNFQRIFPSGPKTPRPPQLRFGDYIVSYSTTIRDGTVTITEPWAPPDSLRGARADSAVRVALASSDHDIRRTGEGLKQTRRWTGLELQSPRIRIADPDSAGQQFIIGQLDVNESDPPFRIRNARGPVRLLGDTAWLQIAHFDLPGSTGSASGRVSWGGDHPILYSVHVTGDSVSLADIHWVHSTLPTSGGGSLSVDIRNEAADPHVLDFAISGMDVRTTKSRLRGAMTFGVGAPILIVKNVTLDAEPLDFDLLRTFNGGTFPADFQGTITGTIRARGGPLNRWMVDNADLTFHDAHVPGATTSLVARGGLDILVPSNTIFRALDVNLKRLDLRTPQFLFPSFPRLRGTITGTTRLDSVWTDLRFSQADLTHRDAPGPPSHFTGNGRVTYGDTLRFALNLQASPLSFTTMAQSYPAIRLRGSYTGPIHASGTMADLDLSSTMAGAAGDLSVDGHFDFAAPGYAARATGSVTNLNVRTLMESSRYPATQLTGTFRSDVRGDSIANLDGSLLFALDRSRVDSVRVFPSVAAFTFGGGRVRVDSLRVETSAANLSAAGGLGLAPTTSDSLGYTLMVDTLGGLRPWLHPRSSPRGAAVLALADPASSIDPAQLAAAIADSLGGRIVSKGALTGNIDTLAANGTLTGEDLFFGGDLARHLSGAYHFRGLPAASVGTLEVQLDSVLFAGMHLSPVSAELRLRDRSTGMLGLDFSSALPGDAYKAALLLSFQRFADSLVLVLDTARVSFPDHAWSLAFPARVVSDSSATRVDSLVVQTGGSTMARFTGRFPVSGDVRASLQMDSLPLHDLGMLAQTGVPLGGTGSVTATLTGTRANPIMHVAGRFGDARYGGFHLPVFSASGDYADRRLNAGLQLYRNGKQVMTGTASLPMNLALESVPQRMLDDSLRGAVHADSVDLSILETISPQLTHATGTTTTDMRIGGTWTHPTLGGQFRINDGAVTLAKAGIRLRAMNADIRFTADSIEINQLQASSGSQPGSRMLLTGSIVTPNLRESRDFGFNLKISSSGFEAINQPSLARLDISGGLQLTGTLERPVLSGDVIVDRGSLHISDISQKPVVNLNDPEFYNIVDTSLVANQGLVQRLPPELERAVENLRVPSLSIRIGDDVWLRSSEANIKLAGSVDLTKLGNQRLESGTLRVSRGTYRLNLGLVQRTFQVDSGFVTFYGDPNIPAELNIWAAYTVRQANHENGQDVTIVAHIGGTLTQPRLELASNERIPLSNTEILSYLLVGQPTFASGTDAASTDALQSAAAALLPSEGAVLERALTDQIRFIDYVQVQTGGTGTQALFSNTGASNVLAGTRIGLGKQIGEKTFITANAGLCQLTGAQAGTSFASSLGVTIEQQLAHGFSVEASVEPSSVALQCRPGLTNIGNRPPQYGFDLFREFSF